MKVTIIDLSSAADPPLLPNVNDAARAIGRQVFEDFGPLWNKTLRLRVVKAHTLEQLSALRSTLVSGDGVIYVSRAPSLDDKGMAPAVAYHMNDAQGLPAGFVFPDIAGALTGAPWTVALSHELLEMLVDPDLNLLVGGPHPKQQDKVVFRAYEVCDPVQASTYRVDGIEVGNFVTPQYFKSMPRHPNGLQSTNFLGEPLSPFDTLPGGSCLYFDPALGDWEIHQAHNDQRALSWADARKATGIAPRSWRRQRRTLDRSRGGSWLALDGAGCANGGRFHW